ncbi:MAG: hypothetical protein NZ581_09000, partial [Candidatus Caldarchaeum sp.]|nr:hypothetical protein [Candidatus Caldarchaeum sp.]MDW8436310.1 hypothetical protein [Candidatus Caldarchaeum sp.]
MLPSRRVMMVIPGHQRDQMKSGIGFLSGSLDPYHPAKTRNRVKDRDAMLSHGSQLKPSIEKILTLLP